VPGDFVYSQSGEVAHIVGRDYVHDPDKTPDVVSMTRCGYEVHTPPWQGEDAFANSLVANDLICKRCRILGTR
jgi:hypothetical protein